MGYPDIEIPNTNEDEPGFVIPLDKMRDVLRETKGIPFANAASRKDQPMSIELYAPKGVDNQTPHDRDEIYVVVSGNGIFEYEGKQSAFRTGDLIYVAAHAAHKFIKFSEDFTTWVIFYGDKTPKP